MPTGGGTGGGSGGKAPDHHAVSLHGSLYGGPGSGETHAEAAENARADAEELRKEGALGGAEESETEAMHHEAISKGQG